MSHQHIQDELFLLDDSELPQRERQRLLAHLDACAACSAQAAQWRSLRGALARESSAQASEAFVETVMSRLACSPEAQAAPRWWPIPVWLVPRLGVALAGILLAVVLARSPAPVSTEALLLARAPAGSSWAFAAEAPDAALLLDALAEAL